MTVYKDKNNHYTGFRCDGHAEYAEPGEDIVCSAVSVLTLNTCNAIEALTEDAFSVGADQETGLVDFDFDDVPGHDAALLIDALEMCIRDSSYADAIPGHDVVELSDTGCDASGRYAVGRYFAGRIFHIPCIYYVSFLQKYSEGHY